jgi:hypothetical protein
LPVISITGSSVVRPAKSGRRLSWVKKPGETRGPTVTSPACGTCSPASTRMTCDLPEPFGPISPTRSPKWISSLNGWTRPSNPSSVRRSTRRALSPPRRRMWTFWSVAGAGGGPAATNRRQRVSAASAREASASLIDARCFIVL